jgi:putative flippase GtrA
MELQRQFKSFIGVGVVSFLVDAFIYTLLISLTALNFNFAKGLSFFAGTLNSYFFNRSLTFKSDIHQSLGLAKHLSLYMFSGAANILVNNYVYSTLEIYDLNFSITFAFFAATISSIVINFLGLKYFVFNLKDD